MSQNRHLVIKHDTLIMTLGICGCLLSNGNGFYSSNILNHELYLWTWCGHGNDQLAIRSKIIKHLPRMQLGTSVLLQGLF
jgi:hypothetical protein